LTVGVGGGVAGPCPWPLEEAGDAVLDGCHVPGDGGGALYGGGDEAEPAQQDVAARFVTGEFGLDVLGGVDESVAVLFSESPDR
jgi:hypothetical protein